MSRVAAIVLGVWFPVATLGSWMGERSGHPVNGPVATFTAGLHPIFWTVLIGGPVFGIGYTQLRKVNRWSWWPLFGAPVALARMVWTWRATCEELGLAVPPRRLSRYAVIGGGGGFGGRSTGGLLIQGQPLRLVSPRRTRVRITACTLVVRVKLLPGQTPAQWERVVDAFAHQWQLWRVRVTTPGPGRVELIGYGFDPLRHPRPATTSTTAKALARTRWIEPWGPVSSQVGSGLTLATPDSVAREVALSRGERGPGLGAVGSMAGVGRQVLAVQAGIGEDGRPWVIDLARRPHWLVTGATQSGKSTLTARVVGELSARPVALVGIDLKGGMELAPFAPRLSGLATSRPEAVQVITALLTILGSRTAVCQEHAVSSVWDLPDDVRPVPILLVVDEVAELILAVDKTEKEQAARCVSGLVRLAQLGAALGIHLWVAGQRVGSELGTGITLLRAQLGGRICHRVADAETANMTLAGLPPEAVTEALDIASDLPGVAVVGDDSGAWLLARSHPLSKPDVTRISLRTAEFRVDLPDITAAIEIGRIEGGLL